MGNVGLLYVGAILFINGCALMGLVKGKGAAPLNVMVGLLQVLTPTYLIFTAKGDPAQILGASGLYLFGFTYLFVAMNTFWDLDGTGLGYFSLFVSIVAVAFAAWYGFRMGDWLSAVMWLEWAFLWFLFFLGLGLGRTGLTWYTGWVAAVQGWITGAVPAFLGLTGLLATANAVALAGAMFVVLLLLYLVGIAPGKKHA